MLGLNVEKGSWVKEGDENEERGGGARREEKNWMRRKRGEYGDEGGS